MKKVRLATAAMFVFGAIATLVFAYGGPDPQITGVTYQDFPDQTVYQLDGATLHYGHTILVTATANDDTTNVQMGCADTGYCKNDGSRPFTRNFVPQSTGTHAMNFLPWGSPGGNIQGPVFTVHYTVVNP